MATGLALKIDGMLAKVESAYAADPTPTAGANGVRLAERIWSTLRVSHAFPNKRQDHASGTLLPLAPAPKVGQMVELEIAVELRGAGAAYSASVKPDQHPFWMACGHAETLVTTGGSESIAYAYADGSHSSCTVYAYAAGKLYVITGCRGIVRWPITAGELGIVRFTLQGLLAATPTEVALPAITYASPIPPAAANMGLLIGSGPGWSPAFTSAEFAQNAERVRLDSGNATDAIAEFALAQAAPTFRLTAQTTPVATYNPYADAKTPTARTIALTLGAVQYNRVKLNVTGAYVNAPVPVAIGQFTGWDLTYDLIDYSVKYD